MLRYICLLCFFVINFELVFCYNYLSENHKPVRFGRNRRARRLGKRQASPDERLQQIDVASFIFKPDGAEGYKVLAPSEYYSKRSYLVPERRGLRWRRRDAPYPEADGLSRYQKQQLRNRHLLHNPKKKSALTQIFPFFSHKKSDTAQTKKSAKKKISIGTCPKAKEQAAPSTESVGVDLHKEQKSQKYPVDEPIEKRFAEQICPKCKLNFMKLKKKRKQPQVIHNSRQYFANNPVKEDVETSSKQFKTANLRKRFAGDKL